MAEETATRVRAHEVPRALVILGHPIAHSLSPRFQNAALVHERLAVRYDGRDVAPPLLEKALAACREEHIGGNVTIPHKEAVAARAGRLTPRAARAGAVNTFWWERGSLIGHNTDVDGILATITALLPRGLHGPVVLLGSGGSAAAVLVALAEMQADGIHVLARNHERATALVERVGLMAHVHDFPPAVKPHDEYTALLSSAALVINTTPVGMQDEHQPVSVHRLGPQTTVFDLVYKPAGTTWVRAARAHGLKAEDGLRMLVEQGAAAFETWFDRAAPRAIMWQALGCAMPAPDRPREIGPSHAMD